MSKLSSPIFNVPIDSSSGAADGVRDDSSRPNRSNGLEGDMTGRRKFIDRWTKLRRIH